MAEGTRLETPIHHLHAVAMEVNSGIASAMLFPLTLSQSYHTPKGNPNGRPILMVNGYLSFGSTWHYQRQRLVEAGFGPIYTVNVGSGKSIKTYAKQLETKVKEIQEETGRNDLTLIGHSKGGLVSSYFATHYADSIGAKIKDVVTIGSPLAGTPVAYLGPGYDAREMTSGSKFHKELRDKIKKHPEIRFSHIASTADEVVPLSSALLGDDKTRQFVLKDLGHLGLVFSSRVADQVCQFLI
jgi:triacylglycerol esterase/lipase EstA (alpha/beta hydrolase family)